MIELREHQLSILSTLQENRKGQVIVPTGGGKTMCMIEDAKYQFTENSLPKTMVIVAPRILLAQQLCEDFLELIDDVDVLHVHSGETHHNSTTKADEIKYYVNNSTDNVCLLYTSPSPRDLSTSRMPSSA